MVNRKYSIILALLVFIPATLLFALDARNNRIKNVATPTAGTDAATKQYVDDTAAAEGHNILATAHGDTTTSAITAGDIIFANATPKWDDLAIGSSNEVLRISGGLPDWQATTFITSLGTIATGTWQATDVGVQYGGTGVSTLTDGGVLLGSGTGAITAMGVLANGSIIVGDGTTDPVALACFTSSTGDLKHEAGGIEADVSGYSGLVGISGGTTSDVNTFSELNTLITDKTLVNEEDAATWDSLGTFSVGVTIATGQALTIGTTTWTSSDEMDGTKIKDADYGDIAVSAGGAWTLDGDCVDESHIADNGIDSEHYNDGSIDLVHLAAAVYAKDIVTTAPITGATDNVLVGADSDVTIAIPVATTDANGYLCQTDWDTFNGKQAQGDVLDDLNTLGAAASDGQFIVATGAGAFAYESTTTARTSLGIDANMIIDWTDASDDFQTSGKGTFGEGGVELEDSGYHLTLRVKEDDLDDDGTINFKGIGGENIEVRLGDWFNQDVRTTASPTFAELTLTSHLNMGDRDIIKLGAGADGQIQYGGSYLLIANETADEDIIFRVNDSDGDSTTTITFDASANKLVFDSNTALDMGAGAFVTTGTLGAGAITGTSFTTAGTGHFGGALDTDSTLLVDGYAAIGAALNSNYALYVRASGSARTKGVYGYMFYSGTGAESYGVHCLSYNNVVPAGDYHDTSGGRFQSSIYKNTIAAGKTLRAYGGYFRAQDYTGIEYTGAGTFELYGGVVFVPNALGDWTTNNPIVNTYGLYIRMAPTGYGSNHTHYSIYSAGGNSYHAGEFLFGNKIKFTQTDGDEYIDSLADGYLDEEATTGIRLRINGTEQINLVDGKLVPTTDDDIDLGDSTHKFKDAYFDGTVDSDAYKIAGTAMNTIPKKVYISAQLFPGNGSYGAVSYELDASEYVRAYFRVPTYISDSSDIIITFSLETDKADATYVAILYVGAWETDNDEDVTVVGWNIEDATAVIIDSTVADKLTVYQYTIAHAGFDKGDLIGIAFWNNEAGQIVKVYDCIFQLDCLDS